MQCANMRNIPISGCGGPGAFKEFHMANIGILFGLSKTDTLQTTVGYKISKIWFTCRMVTRQNILTTSKENTRKSMLLFIYFFWFCTLYGYIFENSGISSFSFSYCSLTCKIVLKPNMKNNRDMITDRDPPGQKNDHVIHP